jgi:DNA-directed RNA polymerase I, II, and III subunit RPABC1
MGKAKDLTPRKISEIKTLIHNTEFSNRHISKIAKVSRASVDRIKKKILDDSPLTPNRSKESGRKKLTTPRDERKINELCVRNRKLSLNNLSKLIQESGIPISPRTARRRIKELGFSCRRPAKKPLLTPSMMEKRLQWAKKHRHWTVDDWRKVNL